MHFANKSLPVTILQNLHVYAIFSRQLNHQSKNGAIQSGSDSEVSPTFRYDDENVIGFDE